jgi:mono/diheme cytochrome c family protein
MTRAWLLAIAVALFSSHAWAQSPTLTVQGKGKGREATRTYTQRELLAHPAIRDVTLSDPVYRRTMTYRAIAMVELLKGIGPGADDYVQARAIDDFSVSIPGSFFAAAAAPEVEAFLAVEDPMAPWPPIPGKPGESAGPFYVVWRLAPKASISSEFWAYRLAALTVTDSPARRWPVLAVGPEVPAGSPIRTGLDRFVEVCMACHRFDGAGEGEQGPDLGRPMVVTQYFQIPALKKLVRDPASVRQLPGQKMPGFDRSRLSDSDLDAIVDWLQYKAGQRR